MKHTPVPWMINEWTQPDTSISIGAVGTPLICRVMLRDVSINEQQANANLIAAAPRLLAALIKVLDEYQGCFDPDHTGNKMFDEWDEVVEARAAIAEATGEK